MNVSARRALSLVLAGCLTLGLTGWLIGSTGLAGILDIGRSLRWSTAMIFPLLWLAASAARACMYNLLLGRRVGIVGLVPLMWFRALVVDLVPARAGLAAIPAALRTIWGIRVLEGVGVLAGVTLVEFAALGLLVLAVCVLSPNPDMTAMHSVLMLMGMVMVLALPGAILAARFGATMCGRGRVGNAVAGIASAVAALARGGLLATVLACSFLTRLAKYAGLYVLLSAMPVPRLAPAQFLAAALAAEATTALPVQGLAGIGTWEAAWVAATTALGFSPQDAVSSAFGLHLLVLGWEILLGGVGLALLVSMGRRA
ncbi:flippase-like domain-containing protein [Candidatus Fermentibacteria bacterium]|nr:flippase-like domain-containing protein [Candidatus Fermentibacteria bacterium]